MIPFPENPAMAVSEILGLAILSGAVAAVTAFAYRGYARDRVPEGLAVLVGLGAVAISLNTQRALQLFLRQNTTSLADMLPTVVSNTTAFLVAIGAAVVSARVGDRLATDTTAMARRDVEGDVGRLVRAVGRVIAVTLPDDIGDMEGYDPVPDEKKDELAGTTLVFPRGLTVAELHDRVEDRLKQDYGVGHVDVDVTVDGEVEFLALGSRASGLGPTLAPGTVAVAVRADPPADASPGDTVQVWDTTERGPERLLNAELRGATDDIVTLVVDAADADEIGPDAEYRLLTLPRRSRPEREFAALLRNAEETMGVVTVAPDGELDGRSVAGVEGTVVAIRPAEGTVVALPDRDRELASGDVVYVIARPESLRRIEAATNTVRVAADTTSL